MTTISERALNLMDAYWRAANYLSVGQIYLLGNPLLKRPLALTDVKHMLLGHWGTTPGQNFIYVHLNRVIKKYDLDMIYVSGPGHGGPANVANAWLEGTYTEIYGHVGRDEAGLKELFPVTVDPVTISLIERLRYLGKRYYVLEPDVRKALARVLKGAGFADDRLNLHGFRHTYCAARLQTLLEKMPAILEASTGIFGAVAVRPGLSLP